LHPLLQNYNLDNVNGILTYSLTREEDDYVMNKLFPIYRGATTNIIRIKECIMLSVDNEKYNEVRTETIKKLNEYRIPSLSTYFGFGPRGYLKSKFACCMDGENARNELTCGMLEIFDKFANESVGNEWLLYFEDDVRPVNIDKSEDLKVLYNIPEDADLIRPYIGSNTKCNLKDMEYRRSFTGGLNHAFYISTNGCKKVMSYTKKYGWKSNSDVDLYSLSKFNLEVPTGFDGWSFSSGGDKPVCGLCDMVNVDSDDEKLAIYHMSHIIFNQTSLPCAPFKD